MNNFQEVISLIKNLDKEDKDFHSEFVREVKTWFDIPIHKKKGKFVYQDSIEASDLIDLYAKILEQDFKSGNQEKLLNHWNFLEETTLINNFDKWEQEEIKNILLSNNED